MPVTFKATSSAIVLLKGKGRHARLSSLPSIDHLMDMALYPIATTQNQGSAIRRVTLEMKIKGDNGIYATAMRDTAIPEGMIPDINLIAYQVSSLSVGNDKSYNDKIKMVENGGGKEMFENYAITFILHVEDTI